MSLTGTWGSSIRPGWPATKYHKYTGASSRPILSLLLPTPHTGRDGTSVPHHVQLSKSWILGTEFQPLCHLSTLPNPDAAVLILL